MSLTVALDARLYSTANTGDSSYWRGLIQALLRQNSDFRFLLFSNTPRPQEIPENEQFSWIHLEAGSRWWSLVAFPRHAIKRGADLIHTQYSLSPLTGNRGITTIHDVSFFIGPEWFQPRDRMLLQRSIPGSVQRAAAVITVSETSKKEIEQHVPAAKGKTHVTYNALGDSIRPMPLEEAKARVAKLLPDDRPYMLTVSTRWPRKNMALAVAAAAKLPESLPHRLVVTGKAGWGDMGSNPRLHTTGYVSSEDLTALYQCADLYLCPSFHEGFGIPLLEAFACECPVLTSSGGALPEVAGDAAVVEPTFDPDSWAKSIADLLSDSDKQSRLIAAGTERLKAFSWDTTAEKTLEVYRRAAERL